MMQCFNSIVVRLKVSQIQPGYCSIPRFQFHSGSIKSERDEARTDAADMFQFHSGSIKSNEIVPVSCGLCEFQFHSGSIKSILSTTAPAGA